MKFKLFFGLVFGFLSQSSALSHVVMPAKTKVGILFVGKTGAGKSTQIVAMHNLILGKRYEDPKEMIIPLRYNGTQIPCNVSSCKHSETQDGSSHSQTQRCQHYHVANEDYEVNLIDTPGFVDTRGILYDKNNMEAIVEEIQNHSINAICLVVPKTEVRQVLELKYYIGELKKMLTQGSQINFIVVLSHATNVLQDALEPIVELGIPASDANVFAFDHTPLFSYNSNYDQKDRKALSKQKRDRDLWSENIQTTEELLKYSGKLPVYESKKALDLHKNRKNLEAKMSEQIELLEVLQGYKQALVTHLKDIDEAKEKIRLNQNYVLREPTVDRQEIPLQDGHKDTVCNTCGKTCHHDCSLPGIYTDMGAQELKYCHAIDPNTGICKHCGHSMGVHQHVKYRIKLIHRYKETIFEPKKTAKEEAEKWLEKLEQKVNETNKQIQVLDKERIPKAYREIANLYHKIKRLALGFTNNYFLAYLDEIEKNLEMTDLSTVERELKRADIKKARRDYELAELTLRNAKEACESFNNELCQ